jgi:UDP-glucose:O-linked fucose beta-1,3-glucosyltransferase
LPGVENTERGHCQKTFAILKYFKDNAPDKYNGWKWLVIADDDTILSVHKLLEYLHCFNHDDHIHLGQRYGYRVATGMYGYDYITGGGGMIFSIGMVDKIVESESSCSCPSRDAPDDMQLGICISNLGLSLVHSPRFHQARPEDYDPNHLAAQDPISFHKFWNTDPRQMYDKWFRQADLKLKQHKFNMEHPHQEL